VTPPVGGIRPMTNPPYWAPTTQPGGGKDLRRSYTILLVMTVLAAVIIVPFPAFLATQSIGEPDMVIMLSAGIGMIVTSICAIAALVRGLTAVRGDQVSQPAARTSRRIARTGSIVGYAATAVTVAAGLILHYRGVQNAWWEGMVLAHQTTHRRCRRCSAVISMRHPRSGRLDPMAHADLAMATAQQSLGLP
jgi:hypothetical protein